MSHAGNLLKKFPIISDQVTPREVEVILSQLEEVLHRQVAGDVVEFGCYVGTTSLFLQRLLLARAEDCRLHVYDSFEGLPPKTAHDVSPAGEQFVTGSLTATKSQFILNFKKANLPLPHIVKGWFSDIRLDVLPEQVAFAFLDGDYYQSVQAPLKLIEQRLSKGATIVVDDYHNEALPGAARAVDDWLQNHPEYRLRTEASLAIIQC